MNKTLKSIKFPGLEDTYVIPEGGSGTIDIDLEGSNDGEVNTINADTLGGVPASEYITRDEVGDLGGSDDISIDMEGVLEASPSGVNADLLGGYSADHYATVESIANITPENIGAMSMELLWENASPTSEFAAQNVSIDLSQYSCIGILCYKITEPLILMGLQIFTKTTIGARIGINEGAKFVQRTIETITNDGVEFGQGAIYNTYAGSASGGNGYVIPYRIYGIKGVSV